MRFHESVECYRCCATENRDAGTGLFLEATVSRSWQIKLDDGQEARMSR